MTDTYLIRRFHRDETHPDHRHVYVDGLTLEAAQNWCRDDQAHHVDEGGVVWFDSYEKEER